MKKKLLALTTALLLLVLTLAACAGGGATSSTTPPAQSTGAGSVAGGDDGGTPEPAAPVELTVLTLDNNYAPASYANDLEGFQQVEAATGVDIVWNTVPQSQWEQVSTPILAGNDMPDIITSLYADMDKLFMTGLIQDLTPLIESSAPNIKKYFEEHPEISALCKNVDGKILSLPIVTPTEDFNRCFAIRQDWLDKLNLEVPKDHEELLEVLRAFRDDDPNGNGKKDEIPVTLSGVYLLNFVWPAMFDEQPQNGFALDDNGKVYYPFISDNYREFLRYMNTLYNEKLLDNGFASLTSETELSMIANDLVGFIATWYPAVPNRNADNPGANWVPIPLPAGPYGPAQMEKMPGVTSNTVITRDCENPEAAIRLLDYLFASEEGMRFANFGVEGVSYEMVDGVPTYTDFVLNNPDGLSPQQALESVGALHKFPHIKTKDSFTAYMPQVIIDANEANRASLIPVFPAGNIRATPEETEALSIGVDLDTYKNEMIGKFVTGAASLDTDWDAYVKQLYDMGLQQLIDATQGKADRFLAG